MHAPEWWGWILLLYLIPYGIVGPFRDIRSFFAQYPGEVASFVAIWLANELACWTAVGMILGLWDNWALIIIGVIVSLTLQCLGWFSIRRPAWE